MRAVCVCAGGGGLGLSREVDQILVGTLLSKARHNRLNEARPATERPSLSRTSPYRASSESASQAVGPARSNPSTYPLDGPGVWRPGGLGASDN